MPLTNIQSDWMSNASSGLWINFIYITLTLYLYYADLLIWGVSIMMSACVSMQLLGYSPRICTYTHSWATNSFVLQYFLAMRIQICFTYPHDHTVFCQIRAYKATQGHHILAVPSQIIYLSKLRKECVTMQCSVLHWASFPGFLSWNASDKRTMAFFFKPNHSAKLEELVHVVRCGQRWSSLASTCMLLVHLNIGFVIAVFLLQEQFRENHSS